MKIEILVIRDNGLWVIQLMVLGINKVIFTDPRPFGSLESAISHARAYSMKKPRGPSEKR